MILAASLVFYRLPVGFLMAIAFLSVLFIFTKNLKMLQDWDSDQLVVLHALQANIGRMTCTELAKQLNSRPKPILRTLKDLKIEGMVDGGNDNQGPDEMERTWAINGRGTKRLQESSAGLKALHLSLPDCP